jgi:4-amino-4-deoxy-L-arabinose transferase-like glycosyltransferase
VTRRELAQLLPLLAIYLAAFLLFPAHPDDEASYITLAERLTDGTYVVGDDDALLDADPSSPDLWFGPGLPALLAPLVAVGAPTAVLRLTGPVLLFGALVLFYLLVRDRWGVRVALLSAYGLGLYLPFWALLSNLHSEVLAIFFVAGGMLAISRYLSFGGLAYFSAAAAALAGLALTRVAYGWVLTLALIVLVLSWLITRSRVAARAAPLFAVAFALCVPWLVYTYSKTDRPFVWGNSGSLSLYWMASPHDGDLGDWRQADDVFTDPDLAPHREFFEGLRGLPLAEQNAEIEREALGNIVDHPFEYGENVVANVSRMLFNTPYSRTQQATNDVFYALPNALVVGAVALCLLVLLPRRLSLPPETGPFVLLGVLAFALHALVATYPRMLMPTVPIVAWLTTLALVELGVLVPEPRTLTRRGTRAPTGVG